MRDESQIYDAYDVDAGGARRSRLGAAVGAFVSLAVLAGVVVWAYRLGVRDATDVPVVRAVEGPMRVRPDDPGGAQAAHQGRAVYDVMADAPPPLETIVIAPPPERLSAEDVGSFARAAPPPARQPEPAQASISDAIASEVDGLVAAVLGVSAPEAPAVAGSVAIARAPAPAPRPAAVRVAARADAPAAAAPAAPVVAVDGPQVQLGAYLSEADALRMWRGFRARNGDLLAGRAPAVAPLVGANRTLYRLRAAPFADMAEARALCAALRSRGEDCLLVEPN